MSNKTQLQINNTSFRNDLLSAIKNLPVQESGLDLAAMFGCTKMAVDTFSFSAATVATTQISHSLGETPTYAIVTTNVADTKLSATSNLKSAMVMSSGGVIRALYIYRQPMTNVMATSAGSTNSNMVTLDASCIKLETPYQYAANVEYTLITLGGGV